MPNRTPTSDTDQTQLAARPPTGDDADPTPAGIPDDGESSETTTAAERPALGGSGAAGAGRPRDALGRFLPAGSLPPRAELRRMHPPHPDQHAAAALAEVSVRARAEHALIDTDVAQWKAAMHLRLERARTILATLRFETEADQLEDALAVKAGMLVRLGSDGGGAA